MPKKPRQATHKHRTPWPDAILEVPAAWLEDKSKRSPSAACCCLPGRAGEGVPAHVMLEMLRRRIHDRYPALLRSAPPAAELNRAQDIVKSLWAATGRAGKGHPTWRAVMGVLALAQQQIEVREEPPASLTNGSAQDPEARR